MEHESQFSFRKIMKLKTICIGRAFDFPASGAVDSKRFPLNILTQTSDFQFEVFIDFPSALSAVRTDQDIDLVFFDADEHHLTSVTMFVTQMREIRPRLPLIIFSDQADDTMRYLLRSGATWHYLKSASQLENLAVDINQHIFLPVRWEEVFTYYARDDVGPRIEPGLGFSDLEVLEQNAEELYIIKRLFANSEVVQIFRMDEGFSGSRIYTVKPRQQLKRILKIDTIDDLEAVQEKQESLIQPRLFRQVGQIRGKVVSAQHLAGACYSLAGAHQEVLTLSQFLQDHNQVRKEMLDKILGQLRGSMRELYNGSVETELRYWAPLYSRILPPALTIESAVWAERADLDAQFTLDSSQLSNLSAVPRNKTLNEVALALRRGEQPELLLKGFVISEVNSSEGVLYLQDTLVEQYPADQLLQDKEHPILRFKIHLQPSQYELLSHPVFRRGKKVAIRGVVTDTQETILARHISDVSEKDYDFEESSFEMASAGFISPLENLRFLLWEVGREDMIVPAPIIAPVIHGDLNAGNILVEADSESPLWLIDFSDARAGHVYFDLAKLEVEFRTHVFYRLFHEMVEEKLWDATTTTKFLLLVENLLVRHSDSTFEAFAASLRDYQSDWYDDLYTQFPLYFENLLYFLFSLRQVARTISPERFRQHYPVAVFFQSIAALKYRSLDEEPWRPWARRLSLCCALVHGREAVAQSKKPQDVARLLGRLRQQSALALITIGQGESRRYLMQWNNNWARFNMVGGRINNQDGDRDSFARTLQRKMKEEIGLRNPKDYHIIRERKPVIQQQFSRRQHIFKEYEFRVFDIEFLPRHPRNEEEFINLSKRFLPEHENVLLTEAEINYLRTANGRPVSETTRIVLQVIGEIESDELADRETVLAFHLDELRPLVTRGRAQITGSLVNVGFGKLIENVMVEVLPSPGYEIEPQSALFHIQQLDAGYDFPLEIAVQPRELETKLTMRATYYDTRGNEYQQILQQPIQFRSPVFSLFQLDNPYVIGKPLDAGADEVFVGREDVFAWMGSMLLGERKANSLILTGQPRLGKTSLLLQLANGMIGRAIRSHSKGLFLPIYCSLQDLNVRQTGELFSNLSRIIARNLVNRGIAVQLPENWPTNNSGFSLFDRFLDEIETRLPRDGRIILIIDDFDYLQTLIDEGWVAYDTLAYLHSLMRLRSRIAFVIAGSHNLADKYWDLIANAGERWQIQRLTRRQTEQLVREPVRPQVNYDELVVEKIWRLTGGHPYFVQLICNRLLVNLNSAEHPPKLISLSTLNTVLDRLLLEDDGHLLALWENSNEQEKLVLAAASSSAREDEDLILASAIANRLRLDNEAALRDLNRTLELLVDRGLLDRVPNTMDIVSSAGHFEPGNRTSSDALYKFSFDLLRIWLNQNHPFRQVLNVTYHDRAISSPF